jgi:hypothetical protein
VSDEFLSLLALFVLLCSFITRKSSCSLLARYSWEGKDEEEVGRDKSTGTIRVRVDPKYYRPAEVELLWGDPAKAKKTLGWERQVTFDELVKEMVLAEWVDCGIARVGYLLLTGANFVRTHSVEMVKGGDHHS